MDTVVVVVVATDSNAPIEVADETEGSVLETITESTVLQATLAGLVLFVLMGTLMIRGQSRRAGLGTPHDASSRTSTNSGFGRPAEP